MDTDRRASIRNDSVSAPSNKPTFVPPPTPLLKKIGYGTGKNIGLSRPKFHFRTIVSMGKLTIGIIFYSTIKFV